MRATRVKSVRWDQGDCRDPDQRLPDFLEWRFQYFSQA